MKISVDAGSLSSPKGNRFGTYVFTENLLKALTKNDRENKYRIYTLPPIPSFWKPGILFQELFRRKDVYLALNQFIPWVHPQRVLSFSHGLSFRFFPHLYPDSANKMEKQLKRLCQLSSVIIVSSQKVKDEFGQLDCRKVLKVIPFGVPYDMLKVEHRRVKKNYFVFVGMDHPIKNVEFIISAFRRFRSKNKYKNYCLYFIGNFKNYKNIDHIITSDQITRQKLKDLYRDAAGYLTASRYESFNLPVLEALSQGCPVIGLRSAIIPELEPFVKAVPTMKEFIAQMEWCADGRPLVKREEIIQTFSWDNYARSIISLYKTL